MNTIDWTLDARGLNGSLLILKTHPAPNALSAGETLEDLAKDSIDGHRLF